MTTFHSRPPRCRQRFNILVVATLTIIASYLLVLFPLASSDSNVAENLECVAINEDYDLRNIARNHNVFLIVHETGEENIVARQHICNKLMATPKVRFEDARGKGKGGRRTVFAYLEVKDSSYDDNGVLQDGGRSFAKTSLGVKKFPSFIFVEGGMDRSSKYSAFMTHYTGSNAEDLDFPDIEKFIYKQTGFYLGNDVYNIIFFDSIASRFVSYGDATGINRLKQYGLALLVRFSTLFSYKDPFLTVGKLYNRAFSMSLEHGSGYCKDQVKILEKKIQTNKDNMSLQKLHELQQKLAILKAFAEPKELSSEDDRQIFIHSLLHIGLIVATLLLFLLPSDTSDEKKEGNDDEVVINAVPVIAKVVDDHGSKRKKK